MHKKLTLIIATCWTVATSTSSVLASDSSLPEGQESKEISSVEEQHASSDPLLSFRHLQSQLPLKTPLHRLIQRQAEFNPPLEQVYHQKEIILEQLCQQISKKWGDFLLRIEASTETPQELKYVAAYLTYNKLLSIFSFQIVEKTSEVLIHGAQNHLRKLRQKYKPDHPQHSKLNYRLRRLTANEFSFRLSLISPSLFPSREPDFDGLVSYFQDDSINLDQRLFKTFYSYKVNLYPNAILSYLERFKTHTSLLSYQLKRSINFHEINFWLSRLYVLDYFDRHALELWQESFQAFSSDLAKIPADELYQILKREQQAPVALYHDLHRSRQLDLATLANFFQVPPLEDSSSVEYSMAPASMSSASRAPALSISTSSTQSQAKRQHSATEQEKLSPGGKRSKSTQAYRDLEEFSLLDDWWEEEATQLEGANINIDELFES